MSTFIGSRFDLNTPVGGQWGRPLTYNRVNDSTIGLELTSPPAENPVTLQEQKDFSRIDGTDEDDLITSLIQMATETMEAKTGVNLIEREYIYSFDGFIGRDEIELPFAPILEVLEVASFAEDNTKTVFDSSNYIIDRYGQLVPARIILNQGSTWPTNTRTRHSYEITFKSGLGNQATVKADKRYASFLTGIKTLVQYWYEEREGAQNELPMVANKIVQKYNINLI